MPMISAAVYFLIGGLLDRRESEGANPQSSSRLRSLTGFWEHDRTSSHGRSSMSVAGKMLESFSWRLALVFLIVGVVAALIVEIAVSDYDHKGVVVSQDGLNLIYETQGEGFPLVALAGGPGISHHGFHPYLGLLRREAMVIYFDPRGRGDSDGASAYRVADDVRDLESLRAGLNLERMDLLGVSYGAHLALAYAIEHPAEVRKLVLVSPIAGRKAWQAHLETLTRAPGMERTLARIRAREGETRLTDLESRERIIETLLPLYWCDPNRARFSSSPSRAGHRMARQNFGVHEAIVGRPFGELNGDLASSDLEGHLDQVRAPILILHGGCDGIIPEGHVAWLTGILPGARSVLFAESGHSPYIDQSQRFAETVGRFLRSDAPPM